MWPQRKRTESYHTVHEVVMIVVWSQYQHRKFLIECRLKQGHHDHHNDQFSAYLWDNRLSHHALFRWKLSSEFSLCTWSQLITEEDMTPILMWTLYACVWLVNDFLLHTFSETAQWYRNESLMRLFFRLSLQVSFYGR